MLYVLFFFLRDGASLVARMNRQLPLQAHVKRDLAGKFTTVIRATVKGNIACADAACPPHMRTVAGVKYSSFDVAAWSDLWFYSNPVFVEVINGVKVAGVK